MDEIGSKNKEEFYQQYPKVKEININKVSA